jgi:hypothetical protein
LTSGPCGPVVLSGISTPLGVLSRSRGQVSHALLTRSPLDPKLPSDPVRLACLIHAANVRSEPGSNSPCSETRSVPTPGGAETSNCDAPSARSSSDLHHERRFGLAKPTLLFSKNAYRACAQEPNLSRPCLPVNRDPQNPDVFFKCHRVHLAAERQCRSGEPNRSTAFSAKVRFSFRRHPRPPCWPPDRRWDAVRTASARVSPATGSGRARG